MPEESDIAERTVENGTTIAVDDSGSSLAATSRHRCAARTLPRIDPIADRTVLPAPLGDAIEGDPELRVAVSDQESRARLVHRGVPKLLRVHSCVGRAGYCDMDHATRSATELVAQPRRHP
jgi:hypothetical protein